jgi:Tat protein translocase TatC
MTLGEHIEELRRRLVIGLGTVLVVFFVSFYFSGIATRVVMRPYHVMAELLEAHYKAEAEQELKDDPTLPRSKFFERAGEEEQLILLHDMRLKLLAPGEGFFFELKLCLYIAVFLGAPVLLWQLWMFVAAGLYARERRVVMRYFPAATLLFLGGVLFGYFVLVPYGMYFLNNSAPIELVEIDFRLSEYWTFLNSLCLGLGLVFQLPIVMVVLARIDVVRPETYVKYRGHTWVGAAIAAAFLTPPDPFTQMMMGIPIVILFEVGIICARMVAPKPLG